MRNPLRRSRKKVFLGGEGMRLLWKLFPQAAFFEVYVPKREGESAPELPLIIESTETRLVEPYTKMFYRLFTARDVPLRRILMINVNCHPTVSRRVAANLAITLASEDLTTCLIDLDVMDSGLHEVFHEPVDPGVVEYLLKGAKIRDIVRQTAIPELKFIPSGKTIMDLEEILSMLGWGETLDRILPRDVVGLIYAGSGKGFDLAELMPEIDGTLLLFSSGARIDRWVRKELKKVRKRSEVVGVVWTNPMEFPLRSAAPRPRERYADLPGREEALAEEARDPIVARGRDVVEGVLLEVGRDEAAGAPVFQARSPEGEEGRSAGAGERASGPEAAFPRSVREGTGGPEGKEISGSLDAREPEGTPSGSLDAREPEGTPPGSLDAREPEGEPPGSGAEKPASPGAESGGGPVPDGGLLFTSSEAPPRRKPAWFTLVGIAAVVVVAWTFLEWRGVVGPGAEVELAAPASAPRDADRETPPGPAARAAGAPVEAAPSAAPGGTAEAGPGATVAGAGTNAGETPAGAGTLRGYLVTGESELPWSLVLGSYRGAEAAEGARDALRQAGFDAQVVPVDLREGLGLWHRVMVGQFRDRETALARLGEILAGSGLRDGRAVNAPWAYLTGMYRSREEADAAEVDLEAAGFDPYLLRTPGDLRLYSVYIGAFESEPQAGPLGERLRARGIDSELVRRSGMGS